MIIINNISSIVKYLNKLFNKISVFRRLGGKPQVTSSTNIIENKPLYELPYGGILKNQGIILTRKIPNYLSTNKCKSIIF